MIDAKVRDAESVPTPTLGREILWLSAAGWMRRLFGGSDVPVDQVSNSVVWAGAYLSGGNVTGTPLLLEGRASVRGDLVHIRGKITAVVAASNTYTYIGFAAPFAAAFQAVGISVDSGNIKVGYCQIGPAGLFINFPAAAALVAGASTFYLNLTYQK